MKNISLKTVVCALSVLFLSGCAEKWEKPGAGLDDFQAMESMCSARAYVRFPPALRKEVIFGAHKAPIKTDCETNGNNVSCVTTGGEYVPPETMIVDDNSDGRKHDIRSCFYENGWRPERD